MFKRRSSKDLSAKIGYDNVNGKASRTSAAAAAAAASVASAPVADVPLTKQGSSSSSFPSSNPPRKSTGTLSPEGSTETTADTTSNRPSPLAAIKSLPPDNDHNDSAVQLQQVQAAANGVAATIATTATTAATTTTTSSTKVPSNKAKSSSSASKVMAEPSSKSLVIGEGVLFEGATEGCAAAVVGGKLVGTVKSKRLEITRAGRVQGEAVVETAEIAGIFEGKLVATKALKVRQAMMRK